MQMQRKQLDVPATLPRRPPGLARASAAPQPPETAVLQCLRRAGRPLRLDEVTESLGPVAGADAAAQLAQLVKRGEVVLNRRGQYCLREQLPGLVIGTVQAQRNGDGWLMPDDASASIYLPSQQMREVIHGDRVAVRIEGPSFRGKPQGAIVEVLERRTKEVVGRLHVEAGVAWLTPDNPRISHRVLVPQAELGGAESGQIVIVELTQQPGRSAQPVGRVTRLHRGARRARHGNGDRHPLARPAVRVPGRRAGRGARVRRPHPGERDCRPGGPARHRARHDRRRGRARLRRRGALRTRAWRLEGDRRDRRRGSLRAAGQRARCRGARARHVGVFPEPRAADAAGGAFERPVLAGPGRGPAVPVLRAARQRRRPHHALAVLRGGDAFGGPAHLSRGRRVPRAPRREARAEDRAAARAAAGAARRVPQLPARALRPRRARARHARAQAQVRCGRAASPRWSSTRATTRIG